MPESLPLTPAGERVLTTAGELFYRDGIHAVGVALVAETAGVTKKTLYDCFGSKDALVARYLRRRHERWWEHLEGCVARAAHPRALAVYDAYRGHEGLDTTRGCAFLNAAAEVRGDHPAVEVIREHKRAVRGRLEELVGEDLPDATAAEVTEVSETLYLILEGATAQPGLADRTHLDRARGLAESYLSRRAAGAEQGRHGRG